MPTPQPRRPDQEDLVQSWQLFPLLLVGGAFVYTFTMRGKLAARSQAMYGGAMDKLRATLAAGQRPDEAVPICFIATERKMMSANIFYLGLTSRRLVVQLASEDGRTFDRAAVRMSIRAKTFTDVGNMQTTYSQGWELELELPDGAGRHTLRVYEDAIGIPEHGVAEIGRAHV